ncbi:MAG: DUF5320 domain-containing protein [Anaerolineae bacterium]|jgi:hypothetical protein
MPGFDGTGPQGKGPMTGRGEGHCALVLPSEEGRAPYGYAGLQGTPVVLRRRVLGRLPRVWRMGRALRRGRGRRRRW